MTSSRPFFRADQVGSLLRPKRLLQARSRWKAGEMTRANLRRIEDDCIVECIAMQQELGLKAVTDGEFRRENWWIDFISAIDGIEISEPDSTATFQQSGGGSGNYTPKNVLTTGKIGGGGSLSVADFDFLKSNTNATPKVMIPSPSRIHFHGGRAAVSREIYPSMDDFWTDVVSVYQQEIAGLEARGCNYIQIDDPVLTYFLDERLRGNAVRIGEDPDDLLAHYGEVINACISTRSEETCAAVHLCRGNAQSQWAATGSYDRMAEILFPRLRVDSWFLEYDDERSGGFEPLRFMPEGVNVVLGLITTKSGAMEDRTELKSRIAEAAQFIPLKHLALSPQCGFASMELGNLIAFEDQKKKLSMVVELAQQIWQ